MNPLVRYVLILIGSISVALGFIGIFLPLLPTTPFLLLGAACYIKGSPTLYKWLINNRILGEYIQSYLNGEGIPLKVKALSISLLWTTISYSAIVLIDIILVKVFLFLTAVGVTWHILSIKTKERKNKKEI